MQVAAVAFLSIKREAIVGKKAVSAVLNDHQNTALGRLQIEFTFDAV